MVLANEIETPWHCPLCLQQLPAGETMRQWARLRSGRTPRGIQVWCTRHEYTVAYYDIQGNPLHDRTLSSMPPAGPIVIP